MPAQTGSRSQSATVGHPAVARAFLGPQSQGAGMDMVFEAVPAAPSHAHAAATAAEESRPEPVRQQAWGGPLDFASSMPWAAPHAATAAQPLPQQSVPWYMAMDHGLPPPPGWTQVIPQQQLSQLPYWFQPSWGLSDSGPRRPGSHQHGRVLGAPTGATLAPQAGEERPAAQPPVPSSLPEGAQPWPPE